MFKLTETDYHAAITENFPQLPIETWEPLHEGWANRTFLINRRLVFRFPKHQVAAHDLVREIRLLTELAPTVPLPIPQYLYHGHPTQHYPFEFGGYAFIEGNTTESVFHRKYNQHRGGNRRTATFPDLLYVLEHNQHEKVVSIMDKIDTLWTP